MIKTIVNFSLSDFESMQMIIDRYRRYQITSLTVDGDPDHNRIVVTAQSLHFSTLTNPLKEIIKDVLLPYHDINKHSGAHPRFGLMDVVPFTCAHDITDQIAEFQKELEEEFNLPCIPYEKSGTKRLPEIRKELAAGKYPKHPTLGTTCIGQRQEMLAINFDLPLNVELDPNDYRPLDGKDGMRRMLFKLPNRQQISYMIEFPYVKPVYQIYDYLKEKYQTKVDVEIIGVPPSFTYVEGSTLPLILMWIQKYEYFYRYGKTGGLITDAEFDLLIQNYKYLRSKHTDILELSSDPNSQIGEYSANIYKKYLEFSKETGTPFLHLA